ncbi:FadR/GntR family transcriptional regulator [Rouxiella sp. WC2420]|uniref:FadR/GntR family transcriptional regulator n=1 Tax=Rouxiella sp. WC2420 TaxID=3234145 RepID=A0AB39VVB2_9GAMM
MASPLSIVRQPLVDIVIDRLRTLITDKTWPVGEKIPNEAELSQLFDVGRNTVREAIRVLSHSGMLEVLQGDGTYVRSEIDPSEVMRQISTSGLREHFELQFMLESHAASHAATRSTPSDLRKIQKALKNRGEINDSSSIEEFISRDMLFHNAIIEATHNEAMKALYRYFSLSVQQNLHHVLSLKDLPEPNLAAHQKLFDAIAAGDAEGAQNAVKSMLQPMINKLSEL